MKQKICLPSKKVLTYDPSKRMNNIEFGITTYCNLRCLECVMHIPRVVKNEHYSLEYIQKSLEYLYGIEKLVLSRYRK